MAGEIDYGALDAGAANYGNFLSKQDLEVRKTNAYNALAKVYGPMAGDPQAAQEAATAQTATVEAPLNQAAAVAKAKALTAAQDQFGPSAGNPEAQQQNLANESTQSQDLRNAQVRALTMLKGSVDPTTGAVSPDAIDTVVGKNAKVLGFQSDDQYQQFKAGLTAPGGAANIDQHIQGLQAPQTVVGARPIVYDGKGNAFEAQTTKTGQTALVPLGNVSQASVLNNQANLPTKQFNAQTARIAATNPKGIVIDSSGNANLVGGGKVTPTTVTSITGPAGTAAKAAATVEGKAAGTNAANALPQNVAIARTDLGQMDLQYQRTSAVLDKALNQIGPLTTGYGGRAAEVLGSPARTALDASLQTAKSNIALLTANMARQGGKSTPVAVRNLQEFKAYQDALGAITPNASASVVRDQIQTAKNQLQALQAGVHAKYKATYGDGVLPSNSPAASPARGPAPPPGLNLPPGFTYVGPAGTP